jgi:hypothetical protein
MIRPIERLLCVVIVRNRNHSAKRKDVIGLGTCLNRAGSAAGVALRDSIDSLRVRVHKRLHQPGLDFHPKFTDCQA